MHADADAAGSDRSAAMRDGCARRARRPTAPRVRASLSATTRARSAPLLKSKLVGALSGTRCVRPHAAYDMSTRWRGAARCPRSTALRGRCGAGAAKACASWSKISRARRVGRGWPPLGLEQLDQGGGALEERAGRGQGCASASRRYRARATAAGCSRRSNFVSAHAGYGRGSRPLRSAASACSTPVGSPGRERRVRCRDQQMDRGVVALRADRRGSSRRRSGVVDRSTCGWGSPLVAA